MPSPDDIVTNPGEEDDPTPDPDVDSEVVELVRASGIFNPQWTMDEVLGLKAKLLEELQVGDAAEIRKVYVGNWFLYSRED